MNDCLSQTLSQAEEDEKKKKIDSINDYLKKLEEEKVIKQAERITKQKDEVHLKKVHRELICDEKVINFSTFFLSMKSMVFKIFSTFRKRSLRGRKKQKKKEFA